MYEEFMNATNQQQINDTICYVADEILKPHSTKEPMFTAKTLVLLMFLIFLKNILQTSSFQDIQLFSYLKNKYNIYVKDGLDFYFYNENTVIEDERMSDNPEDKENDSESGPKKYEDMYLDEFNKLPDEITFTEEEEALEKEQQVIIKEKMEKTLTYEIEEKKTNLKQLEAQLEDIESHLLNDSENSFRKQEMVSMHLQEIQRLHKALEDLQEKKIEDETVNKEARDYVINGRLNGLKNNIIMEKTPLGNVVMFYNNNRSSFEYYSDNTIPYRYLEVAGRKYVITYKCKQIYVDMSKEIEDAEKKLSEKKQKEEDKKKQLEENIKISGSTTDKQEPPKKNVFAKFKTYNKDISIKSAAVPLDRPQPAKQTAPQEDKIVKENANRYSFEGKLANFSFLKKIDRKVVDKRYAISFSEFKKMQKNT